MNISMPSEMSLKHPILSQKRNFWPDWQGLQISSHVSPLIIYTAGRKDIKDRWAREL